ncbi:Uncharacterised protein [Vibrio cholerae]|nr:Uncharacterised protein [Vibrio cholerae]
MLTSTSPTWPWLGITYAKAFSMYWDCEQR